MTSSKGPPSSEEQSVESTGDKNQCLYPKAELLRVLRWATSDRKWNSEIFDSDGQLISVSASSMPLDKNNRTPFPKQNTISNIFIQPSTARESIMAFIGNDQHLNLLADVALGTYSPEGQQPAHAAVTANTTLPAERQITYEEHRRAAIVAEAFHMAQPARIRRFPPRETRETTSLPDEEQQPTRTSTQVANTITPATTTTNASPPAQEQPAQAPWNPGFTPINSAAITGAFAPTIPQPLPRHEPASRRPSGRRRRVAKKSQKSKPRTTGFNRDTGEGMMTSVCGIVTPAKGTPVTNDNNKGYFRCPLCNSNFTRARSVKDHFIKCVNKYGNPNGLSWWDHQTLSGSKNWHLDHLPAVQEEDDTEGHEDGGDQEQYEEEGYGDGYEHYELDGSIARAVESDFATGEKDEDGDSHMGEEDQGRYSSVDAGRTLFHMSNGRPPYYPSDQGSHLFAPNQGSDTPGYGPDSYRTAVPTTTRGLSQYPPHHGGSYIPSFGYGYGTPAQESPYDPEHL